MDKLNQFLQSQKILQIAPHAGDPWIANVYMVSEYPEKIYFIGSTKRLYGKQLLEDPKLAFATAWNNPENIEDRKGVQGVGICEKVTDKSEIKKSVALYRDKYPGANKIITALWIMKNMSGSCMWRISPSYIKYWSDSEYGPEGSKEFNF